MTNIDDRRLSYVPGIVVIVSWMNADIRLKTGGDLRLRLRLRQRVLAEILLLTNASDDDDDATIDRRDRLTEWGLKLTCDDGSSSSSDSSANSASSDVGAGSASPSLSPNIRSWSSIALHFEIRLLASAVLMPAVIVLTLSPLSLSFTLLCSLSLHSCSALLSLLLSSTLVAQSKPISYALLAAFSLLAFVYLCLPVDSALLLLLLLCATWLTALWQRSLPLSLSLLSLFLCQYWACFVGHRKWFKESKLTAKNKL